MAHSVPHDAPVRRVIGCLEEDPRISVQELTRRLALKQSEVVSALRRIEENDLAHVLAVTNVAALRQTLAYLFIETGDADAQVVAEEVGQIASTTIVALASGAFDIVATARVASLSDQTALYHAVAAIEGVQSLRLETMLECYVARYDRLSFWPRTGTFDFDQVKTELGVQLREFDLDEVDLSIMAELRRDGRAGLRSMGRSFGVSEGTVRYRLNKLRERGLLEIVTGVNPAVLGLEAWGIFELAAGCDRLDSVVKHLSKDPRAAQLALMTGSNNVVCTVLAENERALGGIVTSARDLPGVRSVTLSPVTRVTKVDTLWAYLTR